MEADFLFDKSKIPSNSEVQSALGKSFIVWNDFRAFASEICGELTEEWKKYGNKAPWTMKLLSKKRNLLFFTPQDGYFKISFIFGEKAVAAVLASDIPEALKEELRTAKKYAEGRGLLIAVKDAVNATALRKLLQIKISN